VAVEVNGTGYRRPADPVVVVCLDGIGLDYVEVAIAAGKAPTLERFSREGFFSTARSVIPSYTNPNNIAIFTGTTPDINGVPGNYFYDADIGREVMVNSPRFLRCPTLFEAFGRYGLRLAAITAKDKLRRMLHKGWDGICFSAEKADEVTPDRNGIENVASILGENPPDIYSAEICLYSLKAALALVQGKGPYVPDITYVTLTDYIPHRFPPESDEALGLISGVDDLLSEFDRLGCIVGVTSDHGMNSKHKANGDPNVLWLNDLMKLADVKCPRIILPITDPYAAQHGNLGSCAWIHLPKRDIRRAIEFLSEVGGVEEVTTSEEASRRYSLPGDMIGDVFVLGDKHTVFGREGGEHKPPPYLRSHGGPYEQEVPFLLNRPINAEYAAKADKNLRNFNIFEFAMNGI